MTPEAALRMSMGNPKTAPSMGVMISELDKMQSPLISPQAKETHMRRAIAAALENPTAAEEVLKQIKPGDPRYNAAQSLLTCIELDWEVRGASGVKGLSGHKGIMHGEPYRGHLKNAIRIVQEHPVISKLYLEGIGDPKDERFEAAKKLLEKLY